jgi:hypothetical protein
MSYLTSNGKYLQVNSSYLVDLGGGSEPLNILSGLLVYYSLGETLGDSLYDSVSVGAVNTATRSTGTVLDEAGIIGSGILIDSSQAYISIPNMLDGNVTDKIAVSMWIRMDASAGKLGRDCRLFSFKRSTGAEIIYAYQRAADNKIRFYARPNGSVSYSEYTETPVYTRDDATHLVFSVMGPTDPSIRIYINGVDSTTRNSSTGTFWALDYPSTQHLANSYPGGGLGFIGAIDEVGIWNRGLTPSEVSILYNNGNGIAYPLGT